MVNPAWSEEENRLIVADYFDMLLAEHRGDEFNKSERSRQLRQHLSRRNHSSVEYKHRNISSVLSVMGLPIIDGYKALSNIQYSLGLEVERFLTGHPEVVEALDGLSMSLPLSPPTIDLDSIEVAPPESPAPSGLPKRRAEPRILPRTFDYMARDAANRNLGRLGEQLVIECERRLLSKAGRKDLSERVEWTADVRGDGFGYDIASFSLSGQPRFIEVKTTNFGMRTPFFITRNELEFSREQGAEFELCRVFKFSSQQPRLYRLQGPVDDHCQLEPLTYHASVRR